MKIEVDYAGGDDERDEIAEDFVAPLDAKPSAVLTSDKSKKKQSVFSEPKRITKKKPTKNKKQKSKPKTSERLLRNPEKPAEVTETSTDQRKRTRAQSRLTSKGFSRRGATRAKRPLTLILILLLAATAAASGVLTYLYASGAFLPPQNFHSPNVETLHYYSTLTGEELALTPDEEAEDINNQPTFCVQIPNGLDGARPQVGLNKTAVVFEAIAEAGITRFAAVFQPGITTIKQRPASLPMTYDGMHDVTSTTNTPMLGPIRSLRSYYLDWDTPFDCTIVHAGGSPDAVAAVSRGYRDLSESTVYMWRDRSNYSAPNNLFTSSELLTKFNTSKKYTSSNFKAFPRITPDEEKENLANIRQTNAVEDTKSIDSIKVNFGSVLSFNTVWAYDALTNSYLRSYATGQKHETYTCEPEESASATSEKTTKTPTVKSCKKEQVRAKNIAVMVVKQAARAGDKKLRTDVTTVGSGKAYIFKDGQAVKATWEKKSKSAGITFKDSAGNEIAFNPGRLWIQAVPTTGTVKY